MGLKGTVAGVNILGDLNEKPYDMHCPLMSEVDDTTTLNYHKEMCLERQKMKAHKRTCFGGCKVTNKVDAERARLHQLPLEEVLHYGEMFYKAQEHGVQNKYLAQEFGFSRTTISKYTAMYMEANDLKLERVSRKSNLENCVKWSKLKKELGLSNKELAEMVGVSTSTITKYVSCSTLEGVKQ
jgi:DNA-binding XRE family transcriptional regulator